VGSLIEGGFLFLQVLFWDPPNKETHTIVGVTEDRRFSNMYKIQFTKSVAEKIFTEIEK